MPNDSILFNKEINPQISEMEKVKKVLPKMFNFYGKGTMWGVQAGALMALYLFALQLFGMDNSFALKFLKYAFLAVFIGVGLNRYKTYLLPDTIFKNGILLGGYITFISAITMVLINIIAFLVGGEMSFNTFGGEYNDAPHMFVVSGALFFEILVFGMIITFIFLQNLKTKSESGEQII